MQRPNKGSATLEAVLIMPIILIVIVMVIYLIMTLVISNLLRWLEKRIDGADNYDLATTDTLAMTSGMYNYPGGGKTGNRNLDTRGEL